jgi:hypothetical protein
MIQLIANRPVPPSLLGRRLADPDLLLTIAERVRHPDIDKRALVDDFSFVLHDLRMGGTWKRTKQGRLPETERMLCTYLVPAADADVNVLDLGASQGITTRELAVALRRRFGDRVRVSLTDLYLWLLRYRRGRVSEYRAADGEPIMVKVGRFGLRLSGNRHNQRQAANPIADLYLRCHAFRRGMKLDARISLVDPLVQSDPTITVMEVDCLVRNASLTGQFQAVRASNVLNADYFSPAQMHVALGNIHAYLREQGCLVVSRNRDESTGETEHGSVWRKTGSRFSHLADFGAGSEIRQHVDGLGA